MSGRRDQAAALTTSAICVVTTLGCALPWSAPVKLGDGATGAAVLIPAAAICACVLKRPWQTPSLAVFACGLLMDTVTAGPLGYWALMYLTAASVMRAAVARLAVRSAMLAWFLFAVTATAAALLAWSVASLYRLSLAPASELVTPTIVAIAVFPLAAAGAQALLAIVAPTPTPAIRSASE